MHVAKRRDVDPYHCEKCGNWHLGVHIKIRRTRHAQFQRARRLNGDV